MVIILDVSETIKDSDLKQAKEFAQKIVSKVGVSDSPDGTRMGVAIFAETGKEKIYCNNYQTTESLERAVMKLSRDNLKIKLTNLRSGLENGFNILHKNGCGERNTPHQKVMILISDGRANTGVGKLKGIMFAAQKIRAAGVTIIPIAVGDAVKEDVLVEIAGGDKSRLVVGKNFDEFLYSDTIKVMSKQLCKPEESKNLFFSHSPQWRTIVSRQQRCICSLYFSEWSYYSILLKILLYKFCQQSALLLIMKGPTEIKPTPYDDYVFFLVLVRDCSCEENETLKNISKNFSDMKNMIETYEGNWY